MTLPSPLTRYLALVTLVGLLVLANLAPEGIDHLGEGTDVFWVLAGLVALGELLPLRVPRRDAEVTISTAFAFAVLVGFGLPVAALVMALSSAASDVVRRRSALRLAFNVGQYTLSLAAAAWVLGFFPDAVNAGNAAQFDAGTLALVLAAGVAFFLVNNTLPGIASALADHEPVLPHLREDVVFQASTAAVLLGLAPMVLVAAHDSLALVPLLFLPLAAIYVGGWQAALNDHGALHDPLTGLPNRALFRVRAEHAIRAREREKRASLAVMVMDLDRFKEVNDRLGHTAGDLLLQAIALRLRSIVRSDATVARLGGDEFAVVLPRVQGRAEAMTVAERMTGALADPFVLGGVTLETGGSTGVAFWPEHGEDVDSLIHSADVAMYQAKQAGDDYRSHEEGATRSAGRSERFGSELRRAIDRGDLELWFQPQIELPHRTPVAVEALVRWRHPDLGLLPPSEFMGFAETTGLIRPLSTWVLNTALDQARAWRRAGLELDVAVNLSVGDLLDTELPDQVMAALERAELSPSNLTLEITESSSFVESERAVDAARRLSASGVQISIDDFGSGYSSLGYLRRMPIDELKLDRSFVSDLRLEERDRTIIRSIAELAERLDLRLVAEGVEDELTLSQLAQLGCARVQGFHVAAPMLAPELERWLGSAPVESYGVTSMRSSAGGAIAVPVSDGAR